MNISNFLNRKARVRYILIFLILILLLFLVLSPFEEFLKIDKSMDSLDKPLYTSSESVYRTLDHWGKEEQLKQVVFHFTWDLLLPLFYFFFLGFLFSWLTKKGFRADSRFKLLNLLSLVALADILENIALLLLIAFYPKEIFWLSWLKIGFTAVKYYLFGPGILIGLFISVFFAIKHRGVFK